MIFGYCATFTFILQTWLYPWEHEVFFLRLNQLHVMADINFVKYNSLNFCISYSFPSSKSGMTFETNLGKRNALLNFKQTRNHKDNIILFKLEFYQTIHYNITTLLYWVIFPKCFLTVWLIYSIFNINEFPICKNPLKNTNLISAMESGTIANINGNF